MSSAWMMRAGTSALRRDPSLTLWALILGQRGTQAPRFDPSLTLRALIVNGAVLLDPSLTLRALILGPLFAKADAARLC